MVLKSNYYGNNENNWSNALIDHEVVPERYANKVDENFNLVFQNY